MKRWYLLLLALLLMAGDVLSATPAGTVIRNQASASYRDATGRELRVTSNVVETVIEQVAGIDLTVDQQQRVSAGSDVRFSHRLINAGNGPDRYSLQINNTNGDSIDLNGLLVFADADGNGIADNATPITVTPWMGAGEVFSLVVAGVVPSGAGNGDAAIMTLLATSNFSATLSAMNTDSAVVDNAATIRLTKSISASSGVSPSGPFTISLNYENTGVLTASNLVLIDALPDGMSYVPGSGHWSAASVSLTDANPNDVQGVGSVSIQYCAYDTSCIGLPEAVNDGDASSTNQVTAEISTVPVGESGVLSFDVTIDPQLSAGVLFNQGESEYASAGVTVAREFSNTASFTILHSAGVVANGSTATAINGMNEPVSIASAAQGGNAQFDNIIWNTGNRIDTFNIEIETISSTLPVGTVYRLYQADGSTPLLDTNSDGVVDTGPLAPGTAAVVILRLSLPGSAFGNNAGQGFELTKTARSVVDTSVFDTVTDQLDEIAGNQVDLTNQAPAASAGALGTGPGPEIDPVTTSVLGNDNQASFDLYIRHQGSGPDTYELSGSHTAAGAPLPNDWQLTFQQGATGAPVSSTGPMMSGESVHIIATVSIPEGLPAGLEHIYFEARSSLTGASDIKHDAFTIAPSSSLRLEPSLSAQLEAGGSVVYEHVLSNTGNVSVSDILLDVVHSEADWVASVYEDTDGDGRLGPDDQLVSSGWGLLPGESRDVFVKVFAPATAPVTQQNTTTLTASWNAGSESIAIIDTSTVSQTHVTIRKAQVVDTGCDGSPDAGQEFGPQEIVVEPGNNCVIYRLTATNTGVEPSYNVKIHDYTPPYTRYRPSAQCSRTPCWIAEPAVEQTGVIEAETDQLLPGDTFFLQFSVRVD